MKKKKMKAKKKAVTKTKIRKAAKEKMKIIEKQLALSAKRFQEFRPVIDKKLCTKCRACFVFCPDSAIIMAADGLPKIDYDKCKGCLICLRECPARAISEERVR